MPLKIFVEGKDDERIIEGLFKIHHINDDLYDIQEQGGLEKLVLELPTILKATTEKIAIVVDADTAPLDRWVSIKNILKRFGYVAPDVLENTGCVMKSTDQDMKVGVWLMPDNMSSGTLESFVKSLIPDDMLWEQVTHCVDAIPIELRLFNAEHIDKVYVHTWLAWQKQPGKPMGIALRNKVFDPHSPLATNFIQWVQSML